MSRFEEEFKKAIELEKNGKFRKAREKYMDIVFKVQKMNLDIHEKADFLANCWFRVANTFNSENNIKESKRALLKARNYTGKRNSILLLRLNMLEGVIFEKSNNLEKAKRILQRVLYSLKKLPRDYDTKITKGWCLLTLGRIYMREEHITQSRVCFEKALKVLRKINNFVGIAKIYEIKGEFARSKKQFKKAKLNFEKAKKYYKLGNLKNQVKKIEKKISSL